MFEYKVKCRHKLGWKEIKLYADTDIEEFFNRNEIKYVRNITDTIENRQLEEIERLHSIIKEVRDFVESMEYCGQEDYFYDLKAQDECGNDNTFDDSKHKLLEILKGSDKE